MPCEDKLYAIREVSELTGIKPVTLRAWQRRYNIIQPERTEKGHRLYTQQHIAQIQTIQGWLEKGVAIGKVKALLESGVDSVDQQAMADHLDEVEQMLIALAALNKSKADSVLSQVCKEYPLDIINARFIQPSIEALKQVKRSQQTLQFGMFQSLAMAKLTSILDAENKVARRGKCLVVSYDPLGSIELRLWALKLAENGYNISFIEAVDDIAALIEHPTLDKHQALSIFSSQAPSQTQLVLMSQISQQMGEAFLPNPLIESLIQA
ncbi:MerR family transcriptional regulator [Vibrio fluminensis]|uniref:MerR family transcriptional regulator n=1 Tax=Vibrio fluminensis TaxID=2783614 RepID=UPI0018893673|nr:MerR family transcriptional regulator [Vibrio fluminensis]